MTSFNDCPETGAKWEEENDYDELQHMQPLQTRLHSGKDSRKLGKEFGMKRIGQVKKKLIRQVEHKVACSIESEHEVDLRH